MRSLSFVTLLLPQISPTDTVYDLKSKTKELLGIDISQQKLILLGKALAG